MAGIHANGTEIQWVSAWSSPEVTRLTIPLLQDTDVLYLKLASTDLIVLNSTEAITDLSEKRSNIYSDRVSPLSCKTCPLILIDVYNGNQPDQPMLEL